MQRFLKRSITVAVAIVVATASARAQGMGCDSPCKIMRLPLITPSPNVGRDVPVPNSNPLAELRGKISGANTIGHGMGRSYLEHEVDKSAEPLLNGVAPQFPDSLLDAGVSGSATVTFVVGADGRVDTATFKPLWFTNQLFLDAVRLVLPRLRFIPAELHGEKVRQQVQKRFEFDNPRSRPCKSTCPFMLLPEFPPRDAIIRQQRIPFKVDTLSVSALEARRTYFEYEVDKPALQARGSVTPLYPDSLKGAKVEGEAVVAFAVDTLGRVDVETINVVKATNQFFAVAVLEALPRMKFVPAELHGVKVRQLVQQPFLFHIRK